MKEQLVLGMKSKIISVKIINRNFSIKLIIEELNRRFRSV